MSGEVLEAKVSPEDTEGLCIQVAAPSLDGRMRKAKDVQTPKDVQAVL